MAKCPVCRYPINEPSRTLLGEIADFPVNSTRTVALSQPISNFRFVVVEGRLNASTGMINLSVKIAGGKKLGTLVGNGELTAVVIIPVMGVCIVGLSSEYENVYQGKFCAVEAAQTLTSLAFTNTSTRSGTTGSIKIYGIN